MSPAMPAPLAAPSPRPPPPAPDIRAALGLRPIINVAGTMTALGASIVVPEAVAAVGAVLGEFVEIDDLQRKATTVIARLSGAEAGFVTACSSAGITLSVAAAMTGPDLAAIERLPDASGFRNEVLIQLGHMVGYRAPVEQAIRLAGARVLPIGQATAVAPYQMSGAIGPRTAAVLYVVSNHTVEYGQLTLEEVAEIAHAAALPVLVDAASEYDLQGFLKRGADLVIWSAHKFLGGPTAGIIAGRKALVRAAFLQNRGIGRGMKVGKEGIVGAIAALEAWEKRDHAAIRRRERATLELWHRLLAGRPGIAAGIVPDPTGNPLERLKLAVEPQAARITAWDLADRLAEGSPPVIVRDDAVELGWFQLDPCNLHPGEDQIVAKRLAEELDRARTGTRPIATTLAERRRRRSAAALAWPD
ncbi:MAG: aminotransferase class V-fold PLP-dependent enzyme [Acetobacteraceae bacterium]